MSISAQTEKIIKKVSTLLNETRLHDFIKSYPHHAYIVGGWIRDCFLNRVSNDIDIVTKDAKQFALSLKKHIKGTFIPLDEQFHIYRVVPRGKPYYFDIAEIRNELEEDLRTRDFSINALAFQLSPSFQLIDLTKGLNDLENRTLRACSSRSLLDDPLRILRVFRFASLLDFNIHPNLFRLINEAKKHLTLTAGERIQYELNLFITAPYMEKHIGDFIKLQIIPSVLGKDKIEWKETKFNKLKETIQRCQKHDNFPEPLNAPILLDDPFYKNHFDFIRFLAILLYLPVKTKNEFLSRLRLSKNLSQLIKKSIKLITKNNIISLNEDVFFNDFYRYGTTSYISLFFQYLTNNNESIEKLLYLYHDRKKILYSPPLIKGDDLIKQDLPPGPVYQEIIKEIDILKMKNKLSSPERAMDYLKNHILPKLKK